jgi:hypothetical protein
MNAFCRLKTFKHRNHRLVNYTRGKQMNVNLKKAELALIVFALVAASTEIMAKGSTPTLSGYPTDVQCSIDASSTDVTVGWTWSGPEADPGKYAIEFDCSNNDLQRVVDVQPPALALDPKSTN